eukprot:6786666-Karenia_brevis.AAC.1
MHRLRDVQDSLPDARHCTWAVAGGAAHVGNIDPCPRAKPDPSGPRFGRLSIVEGENPTGAQEQNVHIPPHSNCNNISSGRQFIVE